MSTTPEVMRGDAASAQVSRVPVRRMRRGEWAEALPRAEVQLPRRGEKRAGEVVAVQPDAILVDIGAKRDAVIPASDLRQVKPEMVAGIGVGDEVPVRVVQPVDGRDDLIVSLRLGLEDRDWEEARRVLEAGELFEGCVSRYNRGGVLAGFGLLEAFVPNSQCMQLPRRASPQALEAAKHALVGTVLPLKLIEVKRSRQRLVASERAALQQHRLDQLRQLRPGETRTGVVTGLTDFGAFVDLGGMTGLIHVSELAWHYVDHPAEVVQIGETLTVAVLSVDVERDRIGLSRKALLANSVGSVDYP